MQMTERPSTAGIRRQLDLLTRLNSAVISFQSRNASFSLHICMDPVTSHLLEIVSVLVFGKHVALPSKRRGPCQNVHGELQCHPISTRSAQGWAPDGPHDRFALLCIVTNYNYGKVKG